MLHLHQFLCMVDTGVCGQSCSGCSLCLRLDNGICEELGARPEVDLAPWALLQDRVMGWLQRQAGIPGASPGVRTFRSLTLKRLPNPPHYSQKPSLRESGEAPPLYIFNYWVVSEHRLASQVWFLLDRGWTASTSLGSRHHMAHKRNWLSPILPLTLPIGSKTCSPPPPHVCWY